MCSTSPERRSSRLFDLRRYAVIIVVAVISACGKPFNVKPRTELPRAEYTATATIDQIAVQARPITDENLLYETFDANLILAGVLPVRVMLTNSAGETLNLAKARFAIRAGNAAQVFKSVAARQAFKRVISYYEISTYNKAGFKESLDDFSAYALDTDRPLNGRESREGLLFFLVGGNVIREAGLILEISKLNGKQETVQVKLN
jgi:hypothetical protein